MIPREKSAPPAPAHATMDTAAAATSTRPPAAVGVLHIFQTLHTRYRTRPFWFWCSSGSLRPKQTDMVIIRSAFMFLPYWRMSLLSSNRQHLFTVHHHHNHAMTTTNLQTANEGMRIRLSRQTHTYARSAVYDRCVGLIHFYWVVPRVPLSRSRLVLYDLMMIKYPAV